MTAVRLFLAQMVRLALLLAVFGVLLYGWMYDWFGARSAATTWFTDAITSSWSG